MEITNTANTFGDNKNRRNQRKSAVPEVAFQAAGSFGNVNNSIIIDGGQLDTESGTSILLASTHQLL